MRSAVVVPKAVRCVCAPCLRQGARFHSTGVSPAHTANNGPSHIASSLAGGAAAGAVLCSIDLSSATSAYKHQDNTSKALDTTSQNPSSSHQEELSHDPQHAINYIKDFCYSHVTWVPGGQRYLNNAFQDMEVLKQSHEQEVDCIVNDIYEELQAVSNAGFSFGNVTKTFGIFTRLGDRLGAVAGGVRPSSATASAAS
jgi:hypothetical protein